MAVELTPQRLARADWDDVLRELTVDMDPWDIDLVLLLKRYRAFLLNLRAQELEIPGRMLLVGAVLLRLKAECLREEDGNGHREEEDIREMLEESGVDWDSSDVYISQEFRLPLRRRPRRRLTIKDLERALRLALVQEKRKGRRLSRRRPSLPLRIQGEPFSKRAARLLRKLLSLVNGKRDIPFTALLERGEPGEAVARFLELLHLDKEGKVILKQRRFLGELVVEVPPHVGSKSSR